MLIEKSLEMIIKYFVQPSDKNREHIFGKSWNNMGKRNWADMFD